MNILVPHSWLLEHLATDAKPENIQKCLSLCGPSVERIHKREGEPVYDIEVTTNRVDAAGVRGIAREASVILPEFGFKAELKPLNNMGLDLSGCRKLDIEIKNDPALCRRIVAVKLQSVKLGQSPEWLKKRLRQIDLRPLNNAIDITNYIMWDIGHPIHAFDYDRITSKKIIVREAKPGEKFKTLDEKTHTCRGGEVVFDDGTGTIIDLPGIMGTANTAVTGQTKNILLWIESVDPVKIRQASMGLSIRSQAAVLNEKEVDPEHAPIALSEAARLFTEITGATVGSCVVDIYPEPDKPRTTSVTQAQIDTYMGLHVTPDRVHRILTALGCTVETGNGKEAGYRITPPSWRVNDLQIPQDYIEEIARIYGYHNVPSVIMQSAIPHHPPKEDFRFEQQVKQWLAGWGASEIYTYSMVSKELAIAGGYPLSDHLKIVNPLSDEWMYLRRTLIPSLKEVIAANPNHDLTIFEMQNVYIPKTDDVPEEELRLTVMSNRAYPQLKGMLDALTAKCYVDAVTVVPSESAVPFLRDRTGTIKAGNTPLGQIGAVGQNLYAFDIVMAKLQSVSKPHPTKLPIFHHSNIDGTDVPVRVTVFTRGEVQQVEIYVDGVGRETLVDEPFETTLSLVKGKHTIKVRASRNDGKSAESGDVHIGTGGTKWDESEATPTPTSSPSPSPTSP